jgi:hypothetical protein
MRAARRKETWRIRRSTTIREILFLEIAFF